MCAFKRTRQRKLISKIHGFFKRIIYRMSQMQYQIYILHSSIDCLLVIPIIGTNLLILI